MASLQELHSRRYGSPVALIGTSLLLPPRCRRRSRGPALPLVAPSTFRSSGDADRHIPRQLVDGAVKQPDDVLMLGSSVIVEPYELPSGRKGPQS
jgi:hypothetical protein